MFPAGSPEFTVDQQNRLKSHGVSDEQIEELRYALIEICRSTRSPTANNDVTVELEEIASLCSQLSRKLNAAIVPEVEKLIEKGYWTHRPMDDGGTVARHLCPRLDALALAATAAANSLPKNKPVRTRGGDHEPIRLIYEALLIGWFKAHGSYVEFALDSPCLDEADMARRLPRGTSLQFSERRTVGAGDIDHRSYPDSLRPCISSGPRGKERAFPEIVAICYAAAGYGKRPKRALEAFVKSYYADRKELVAALDSALSLRE